jgi:MOSC domain-containing protein YiiM
MSSSFFHVTSQLPDCRAREGGTVVGVAASPRHRFSKTLQPHIHLRQGWGVENDAHAGRCVQHVYERRQHPRRMNQRQVHLISVELIDALNLEGFAVRPGELGENLTTSGLMLEQLPLRTRLRIGRTAAIELTGTRRPCRQIDRFRDGLLSRIRTFAKAAYGAAGFGALATVLASGDITSGDRIEVELPTKPYRPLPAL